MWQEYGHMGDWGWGVGFGLGWIFPILFWVLIIWLVITLVRSRGDVTGGSQHKNDDALDILRKRYASGEITKEQFEQMKKDLS